MINDKTVPDVKVGILVPRNYAARKYEERDIKEGRYTPRASTKTDSEGVFRLENLIEGEYRLAIMTDEKLIPVDAKKVKVINAPGRIILNAQNPTVDLGEIEIMVAR